MDAAASFTVSKIQSKTQLGRDLVAEIDIGPVMSRKILKSNGQVLYRTSVRSLTLDEIQSPTEIAERLKLIPPLKRNLESPCWRKTSRMTQILLNL
jgi:hypothetical protein